MSANGAQRRPTADNRGNWHVPQSRSIRQAAQAYGSMGNLLRVAAGRQGRGVQAKGVVDLLSSSASSATAIRFFPAPRERGRRRPGGPPAAIAKSGCAPSGQVLLPRKTCFGWDP